MTIPMPPTTPTRTTLRFILTFRDPLQAHRVAGVEYLVQGRVEKGEGMVKIKATPAPQTPGPKATGQGDRRRGPPIRIQAAKGVGKGTIVQVRQHQQGVEVRIQRQVMTAKVDARVGPRDGTQQDIGIAGLRTARRKFKPGVRTGYIGNKSVRAHG